MSDKEAITAIIAEAMPALEVMAASELAKRRGKLVSFSVEELVARKSWISDEMERDGERDYRRGYCHGYGKAMDDLRSSSDASAWVKLAQFFDGPLKLWRYMGERNLNSAHPPPQAPSLTR